MLVIHTDYEMTIEFFLAFRHFYRKKLPARAANRIAGNHKITLVVHK